MAKFGKWAYQGPLGDCVIVFRQSQLETTRAEVLDMPVKKERVLTAAGISLLRVRPLE